MLFRSVPPIKGVENVCSATDVYGKEETLGERVIVIGGGQVGCESALHLAKKGKKVTVIEMGPELVPDASITHRGEIMAEMKKEPNFTQIVGAKCFEINKQSVGYEKDGEDYQAEAEAIVLAKGMKPRSMEADDYADVAPYFRIIGDCVRARTVEMAVREGYFAGINL